MTVTTAPRPVFCPTEHEHRDPAIARDAIEGRFTVAGHTLELGTDPDWTAGLAGDEEWRIEWVKFAWGLDLATAGGPEGLAAWERYTASWRRQMAPDSDPSEVTARRILNWIYAWQRLAGAPDDPDAIARSIAEQAAHVRANLTPGRNHRTLELYALFVTALAFPDDELLAFATAELDRNLRTDFRADGVHVEASTHYHLIALRSFVAARENARRHGVSLPDGFDERLARACAFALHCRRPDGLIPALSDADTGDYAPLLALAGELLDDDELRWAGTDGRTGAAPARTGVSFPDGGYHVQRSGWTRGRSERFLILDCGPLGAGGHGHYDLLSVEAFARRPLVVDPGRFTYSEAPPNLRRWFKGTAAHNTVCVDGLDQTPYARTRPRGDVAHGRLLGRASVPGLDLIAGEAVSPAYEAVHQRRVAFVAEAYWIVEDRLWGAEEHRYDLRWHLAAGAEARAGGDAVLAPGLALLVTGAPVGLERGWVAPEYGVRLPAPVVSAVAVARRATFVTVIAPLRPGEAPPRVTRVDDAEETTALRIGADRVVLHPGGCRWQDGRSGRTRTVSL
jgi:uncharacterized heparinase superfamily protein